MVAQLLEAIARRGLASGISLCATSYLAHHFAASSLGTYAGMLAMGQILLMIFLAGLDVSPLYMIRNQIQLHRRVWTVATAGSLGLAASCLLLGAIALNASLMFGPHWARVQAWGWTPFLYAAGMIMLMPQYACLQGLLQFRTFNLLQIGYPLSVVAMILAVDLVYGKLSASAAVLCWGAAGLLVAIAAALVAIRRVDRTGHSPVVTEVLQIGAFFRFSMRSYLANCIGTLNSRLPNLLVTLVLVPDAAGLFAGAVFLCELFSFFSFAIASVTLPALAGVADTRLRMLELERACRLNSTFTLAAVAVFLALFEPLCRLLLGTSFITPTFSLMAMLVLPFTVPHSTARILCTDLTAQGKPLWNALPNVPATIVFVALLWGLRESWGVWGAVIAYCASSFSFSALAYLVYRQHSPIRLTAIGLVSRADVAGAWKFLRDHRFGQGR